jgi:hypothetical protein
MAISVLKKVKILKENKLTSDTAIHEGFGITLIV